MNARIVARRGREHVMVRAGIGDLGGVRIPWGDEIVQVGGSGIPKQLLWRRRIRARLREDRGQKPADEIGQSILEQHDWLSPVRGSLNRPVDSSRYHRRWKAADQDRKSSGG